MTIYSASHDVVHGGPYLRSRQTPLSVAIVDATWWDLLRFAGLIGAFLWIPVAFPAARLVEMLLLAAIASASTKWAVRAMSLAPLLSFLNPALVAKAPYLALAEFALMSIGALRIYYDAIRSRSKLRPAAPIMLFASIAAVTSWFASGDLLRVSLLKLAMFFLVAPALYLAFRGVPDRAIDAGKWLAALVLAVVGSSAPLLSSPVGYFLNGRGFQGILSHPQSFGVILALGLSWIGSVLIASKKPSWLLIATFVVGSVEIYASQSRTAVFATLGGFLVTIAVGVVLKPAWRRLFWRGVVSPAFATVLLLGIALCVANAAKIAQDVKAFAAKGAGDAETINVVGNYQESRGELLQRSLDNFYAHPAIGIGFGIASDPMTQHIEGDSVLGLPTSAPTEKGNVASAILEETGLVGGVGFLILVVVMIRRQAVAAHEQWWPFATCLLVNFGEMGLFSMGGLGLLIWVFIGIASRPALRAR
jgi:hypothetical protein